MSFKILKFSNKLDSQSLHCTRTFQGLWDFGHLLICLILVPANCEYVDQPGTYLPFTDTYLPRVNDIEECRSHCTIQGKYNCRSFNYNAFRKECFLSSDDSVSLSEGLHNDRDFIFSERGGCNSGTNGKPGIKGEPAKSARSTDNFYKKILCFNFFRNFFLCRSLHVILSYFFNLVALGVWVAFLKQPATN
jgi:hypothetical protein